MTAGGTGSSSRHSAAVAARRASPPGRRFFVPIGVQATGGRFRDLPGVAGDVARMSRAFSRLGYAVAGAPPNPSAAELRLALGGWLEATNLQRSDGLVLYFSGHGLFAGGDHYLCPRGVDLDLIAATGLKASDLVDLVVRRRSRPGRFWLILDCCQAGGALDDGLLGAVAAAEADAFVLAAGTPWDQARDGQFSRAFCAAIGGGRGARGRPAFDRGPARSLDGVTQAINRRVVGPRAVQAAVCRARFDLLDEAEVVPAGRRGR